VEIIYSFNGVDFVSNRINCEKHNLEIFFCKLILSVNTNKKHFNKLSLYTDVFGALLLERLELPFSAIYTNSYALDFYNIDCNLMAITFEDNRYSILGEVKQQYPEYIPKLQLTLQKLERRGLGSEYLYEDNL
jgi:hypothetical protein